MRRVPAPVDLGGLLKEILSAPDPVVRLAAITQLRRQLEAVETEAAADALRAGLSWREIGAALGISKQAAHRRHSKDVGELDRAAATQEADNVAVVSSEVRQAVKVARREAGAGGAGSLGTAHLLLGLLQCGDAETATLLRRLGVTAAGARTAVEATIEIPLDVARRAIAARDGVTEPREPVVLSPLARSVVSHALRETVQRGSQSLEALDLLHAILQHDHGGAAQTLIALGVSPEEVRRAILGSERLRSRGRSGPPGQERTGAGPG